jgi:hypothetical protein
MRQQLSSCWRICGDMTDIVSDMGAGPPEIQGFFGIYRQLANLLRPARGVGGACDKE